MNIINKYLTTVVENLCDVLLCSLREAQQRHQMWNHSDVLKTTNSSYQGNKKKKNGNLELEVQASHIILCASARK